MVETGRYRKQDIRWPSRLSNQCKDERGRGDTRCSETLGGQNFFLIEEGKPCSITRESYPPKSAQRKSQTKWDGGGEITEIWPTCWTTFNLFKAHIKASQDKNRQDGIDLKAGIKKFIINTYCKG